MAGRPGCGCRQWPSTHRKLPQGLRTATPATLIPLPRSVAAHARPEERDRRPHAEEDEVEEPGRIVAISPAVGIYHPRRDLAVGMRVQIGRSHRCVDVLGVNQDVVSPVDGIIGSSLAEAGEAVEYGQELVRIELPERDPIVGAAVPARGPAGVAGKV